MAFMWHDIVEFAEKHIYYPDASTKLRLTKIQKEALTALAAHKTVVVCVPKRQGKTLISAVAALYALHNIPNSVTIILSTSREHAASVTFRRTKELLRYMKQTLKTPQQVKEFNSKLKISQTQITYRHRENESIIETVPCVVDAVAGKIYDLLIIDELALISDEEVVTVAMSQSEKPNSRILITSTASSEEHILYRLYREAQQGGSNIHFIYRSGWEFYASDECNPAITREFVETQRRRMIEPLFRRYFLNEFGSYDSDEVFGNIEVANIQPNPAEAFPNHEFYETYIGVDRALPFSKHGDLSAAVTLHKIMLPDNTFVYLVGDAVVFKTGEFHEIWHYIMQVSEQHPLACVAFEVYQCYDLYSEAQNFGIPTELIHVNPNLKHAAFNKIHNLLATRKLIIPATFTELIQQLSRLRYKSGRYEAPAGYHDDLAYALAWAVEVATRRVSTPFYLEPYDLL